jgi:hypothetical protein
MPESRKTEIPASPRRILPPALRATPLLEGGTLAREMAPENRNPGHPNTCPANFPADVRPQPGRSQAPRCGPSTTDH